MLFLASAVDLRFSPVPVRMCSYTILLHRALSVLVGVIVGYGLDVLGLISSGRRDCSLRHHSTVVQGNVHEDLLPVEQST